MTVIRTDEFGGAKSTAIFSDCGGHRFLLARSWSEKNGSIVFLMLNPSTANESRNDPTIGRCHSFSMRFSNGRKGGYMICNLFSLITPVRARLISDPDCLRRPENDRHIVRACRSASRVICAWGGSGQDAVVRERAGEVVGLVRMAFDGPLECFGSNGNGAPTHPLFQPVGARLMDWDSTRYLAGTRRVRTG